MIVCLRSFVSNWARKFKCSNILTFLAYFVLFLLILYCFAGFCPNLFTFVQFCIVDIFGLLLLNFVYLCKFIVHFLSYFVVHFYLLLSIFSLFCPFLSYFVHFCKRCVKTNDSLNYVNLSIFASVILKIKINN